MRIQLYNPPVHHYAGLQYRMLPTLGLPTLTAWLNRRGHDCEAVDLEALGVTPQVFARKFAEQSDRWPDVVGVTGLTITRRGMREIVQAVRAAGFTGPVVVGGVHATMYPEQPLEWGASLVVTGECEGNIVELLETGATGVHQGVPADIAEIPAPDWPNWYPAITSYQSNIRLLLPNPGISMWTRGCPYQCIFCGNTIYGGRPTRYRPAQNIEADMLQLKQQGVQNVYVYDDEMVGTKLPDGWMRDIADRIEGLGLKWITQGRCSARFITPGLLKDMKRAGGHTVFWGIESWSPKVLKAVKKGITPGDIWHTLRQARAAGIDNALFLMIGNYQETEDDLELTCRELSKAYKEGLVQLRQTTICTPMPGTRLAELAQAEGWYTEAPDFGQQMLQHSPTPWLPANRMDYWLQRFWEAAPVGLHEVPARST